MVKFVGIIDANYVEEDEVEYGVHILEVDGLQSYPQGRSTTLEDAIKFLYDCAWNHDVELERVYIQRLERETIIKDDFIMVGIEDMATTIFLSQNMNFSAGDRFVIMELLNEEDIKGCLIECVNGIHIKSINETEFHKPFLLMETTANIFGFEDSKGTLALKLPKDGKNIKVFQRELQPFLKYFDEKVLQVCDDHGLENFIQYVVYSEKFHPLKYLIKDSDSESESENEAENLKTRFHVPNSPAKYSPDTNIMGIDFGTTRCVLAVSRNKEINVIPIDLYSGLSMPMAIAFDEEEPLIGTVALKRLRSKSEYVIFSPRKRKRLFCKDKKYDSLHGPRTELTVKTVDGNKSFKLREILAIFLKAVNKSASIYQLDLNNGVGNKKGVITLPTIESHDVSKKIGSYNNYWLNEIIKAAKMNNIQLIDLISQTEADLFYYLSKMKHVDNCKVLVIHCGSGTSMFTGYKIIHGKISPLKNEDMICFKENLECSGDDIDMLLIDLLAEELKTKYKIDIFENNKDKYKIYDWAVNIKHDLSLKSETALDVSVFDSKIDAIEIIERSWFEENVMKKLTEKLIKELSSIDEKFDYIFLSGGTCYIPFIQKSIQKCFPSSKLAIDGELEIITGIGAAIHGLRIVNGEIKPLLNLCATIEDIDWLNILRHLKNRKKNIDQVPKPSGSGTQPAFDFPSSSKTILKQDLPSPNGEDSNFLFRELSVNESIFPQKSQKKIVKNLLP